MMVSRPDFASTSTSARARMYTTATGAVGLFDAATAIDNGGGREIRAGNMRHQPFNADVFIVNIRQTAVNHFRQVMRRYVGGHPYGDPEAPFTSRLGILVGMTSGIRSVPS